MNWLLQSLLVNFVNQRRRFNVAYTKKRFTLNEFVMAPGFWFSSWDFVYLFVVFNFSTLFMLFSINSLTIIILLLLLIWLWWTFFFRSLFGNSYVFFVFFFHVADPTVIILKEVRICVVFYLTCSLITLEPWCNFFLFIFFWLFSALLLLTLYLFVFLFCLILCPIFSLLAIFDYFYRCPLFASPCYWCYCWKK